MCAFYNLVILFRNRNTRIRLLYFKICDKYKCRFRHIHFPHSWRLDIMKNFIICLLCHCLHISHLFDRNKFCWIQNMKFCEKIFHLKFITGFIFSEMSVFMKLWQVILLTLATFQEVSLQASFSRRYIYNAAFNNIKFI